jgi:hypothetical protein
MVEITLTSGKHVVIAVQAPRPVLAFRAGKNRPIPQEMIVVLFRPSRIVNVAEVNDMLIPLAFLGLYQRSCHQPQSRTAG